MSSSRSGGRQEASALGKMAQEADALRAAKHQVIVEAREMRHKEMERLRKEEDETDGKPPKADSYKSRYSNRRGSEATTLSSDSNTSDLRELRSQFNKLETKYKEAMFTNAQLDNEKQILRYEVDLLKDKLEDKTDDCNSLQKAFNNKKREFSYQKMQIEDLQRRVDWQHRQIEARDQLITEHGLVIVGTGQEPDSTATTLPNGNASNEDSATGERVIKGMALLSKETADLLGALPSGDLESRLREIICENNQMKTKIEALENRVEEEKSRADLANKYDSWRNGMDTDSDMKQKLQQAKNQAQEFKLQIQKNNQKISSLESEIIRYEGQVKRYKSIAEASEKKEEELKAEKRKLQKDFRDAQSNLEDLKSENSTLQRKLDKLKSKNV